MLFWTSIEVFSKLNTIILWSVAFTGGIAAISGLWNYFSRRNMSKKISTFFTTLTAVLTFISIYSNSHLSELQNNKDKAHLVRLSNLSTTIMESKNRIKHTEANALDAKIDSIKTREDLANEKLKLLNTQHEVADARKKQIDAEASLGKIQEKLRFRTFTDSQRTQLIKQLTLNASPPIRITVVSGNQEAMQYAKQLMDILKEAKWEILGGEIAKSIGSSSVGLFLIFNSPMNAPRYVRILQDALAQVGVNAEGHVNSNKPENYVELFVGLKPQ